MKGKIIGLIGEKIDSAEELKSDLYDTTHKHVYIDVNPHQADVSESNFYFA